MRRRRGREKEKKEGGREGRRISLMRSRSWREITAGRGEERGKTSSRDAIGSPHTPEERGEIQPSARFVAS